MKPLESWMTFVHILLKFSMEGTGWGREAQASRLHCRPVASHGLAMPGSLNQTVCAQASGHTFGQVESFMYRILAVINWAWTFKTDWYDLVIVFCLWCFVQFQCMSINCKVDIILSQDPVFDAVLAWLHPKWCSIKCDCHSPGSNQCWGHL